MKYHVVVYINNKFAIIETQEIESNLQKDLILTIKKFKENHSDKDGDSFFQGLIEFIYNELKVHCRLIV